MSALETCSESAFDLGMSSAIMMLVCAESDEEVSEAREMVREYERAATKRGFVPAEKQS